jgi:NADPH:quinone reductase-like Zn-dependent oxidoreductase
MEEGSDESYPIFSIRREDVLEYVEVAKPLPQADDLLIEVTASGVNFVDIRERMGVYARPETPGEFLPGLLS